MKEWIHFEKGEYLTEQTFLLAEDGQAVFLKNAVVEIYQGRQGIRQLRGHGLVSNHHIVQLLEDNDDLDLILDFGETYRFRLTTPAIQAGKFFTPEVESLLHFYPNTPWVPISEEEFEKLCDRARFVDK
jgi:hypothetical protein